jgi:DNA-binding GntR family transcriptional regulator
VLVPPQTTSLPCDDGVWRRAIAESLRKPIVPGQLRPGQHLVTQTLVRRFGVSHTPVREALIALAGIGLVDLLPHCGTIIRAMARHIRSGIPYWSRALPEAAAAAPQHRTHPYDDGEREPR